LLYWWQWSLWQLSQSFECVCDRKPVYHAAVSEVLCHGDVSSGSHTFFASLSLGPLPFSLAEVIEEGFSYFTSDCKGGDMMRVDSRFPVKRSATSMAHKRLLGYRKNFKCEI